MAPCAPGLPEDALKTAPTACVSGPQHLAGIGPTKVGCGNKMGASGAGSAPVFNMRLRPAENIAGGADVRPQIRVDPGLSAGPNRGAAYETSGTFFRLSLDVGPQQIASMAGARGRRTGLCRPKSANIACEESKSDKAGSTFVSPPPRG